jgi:hypothetical protein
MPRILRVSELHVCSADDQRQEELMKTRVFLATCTAIAAFVTVGVLAQDAPSPQAPASSTAKAITVSGCVERAQAAPTGTSGTAASAASVSEPKFILKNPSVESSGTTGTAGSASASASPTEYRLDADDAKLASHVGHKVEITGNVESMSASAGSAPKLKVDSVKMIGATCQ